MNNFFITGTDTGIGKTLTSAILTLALQGSYWKPIQSDEISDRSTVQELTGLSDKHFFPSAYDLGIPLSPNHAAEIKKITIDLAHCQTPHSENSLIVEGAGGVFVPLNKQDCMLDLMQQINFPIIIVSRGTIGTINHTLLTLEALRKRNLPVHGIIFCGELKPKNQETIMQWSQVQNILHVPTFAAVTPNVIQQWVKNHTQSLQQFFLKKTFQSVCE